MLVKVSYLIALALLLFGAAQRITHTENAETWLFAGLLAQTVFIVLATSDVWQTPTFTNSEKWMWTVALICISHVAGAIYLLSGRKRARRRLHS